MQLLITVLEEPGYGSKENIYLSDWVQSIMLIKIFSLTAWLSEIVLEEPGYGSFNFNI
jgi:hypothetical protein